MRRRLRKKLHGRYLGDVLAAVSLAPPWRARLFEAPLGEAIPVHPRPGDGFGHYERGAVARHGLRFLAARVPHRWTDGWEGYEDLTMFRVWAAEFPSVSAESANNPETAYSSPALHR